MHHFDTPSFLCPYLAKDRGIFVFSHHFIEKADYSMFRMNLAGTPPTTVLVQAAKRFVRLSQNDLCDFHVY